MQNLKIEDNAAQRLHSVIGKQVGKIITQLQEIESLYLTLKDLSAGLLSHHLIKKEILQDNLDILEDMINKHNPQAKMVYK